MATLPDGCQLADAAPIRLADQILSECFSVDQVRVLNAQQLDAPANGMLIPCFSASGPAAANYARFIGQNGAVP